MKQKLKLSILLLLFMPLQKIAGQDIIMGSQPLVPDIGEEVRFFYDPGGVDTFATGLRLTTTLQTEISTKQLYVWFQEFQMGDRDTLWIYDGSDANAPLMGCYSLKNSPVEVFSTGNTLTFVFHSDSVPIAGMNDGWRAQVYQYDSNPVGVIYGDDPYVVTCNAVFYDAGGPNGNIGTATPNNNFTEFTSPVGSHVKCEFTHFSVGGVLKIYDGQYNSPNKRLIGQYCTSTLDSSTNNMPPVLFSTTNTLCFVYEGAAGDANKSGWKAHISCVPELLYDLSPVPAIENTASSPYANTSNPVVVLQAHVNAPGQDVAYDYMVEQIPYDESNMLFAYNEGNSINASQDDQWLSGVQLPFVFHFFGQPYTTVYPGTNGLISLTPRFSEGISLSCAWAYGQPPTSPPYNVSIQGNQTMGGGSLTIPFNYSNCIYGVYEDIDCRYFTGNYLGYGAVRTGVLGEYPCRAFVSNYLNVGLFGNHADNDHYNTYQMVLYEGTNIIDVYVKHRKCCASTNSRGEGIIGLQNSTSSQILLAPGRGMTGWNADNEAWRFTPITLPAENGELTWYKDVVDDDHIISYSSTAKNRTIAVRPTETSSYISQYRYVDASGNTIVLRDTTLVLVPGPEPIDSTGVAVVHGTDFTVYPNPARDAVYVKMNEGIQLPMRLEVLDLQGRILFTVPAQETTRVDLSRLPAGVYLLKASDGRKGSAVKITKQ